MKRKILLITLVLGILILSSNVMAFMPREHWIVLNNIINSNQSIGGTFFNACKSYPTLCLASAQENDVGVIWYYSNGGILYDAVHSPTFCHTLLQNVGSVQGLSSDQAMACAVGGCIHMEEDLPSHGKDGMVTYSIQHTLLPNGVIHVFSEQHLDNIERSLNPDSDTGYRNSLLQGYLTCEPLFVQSMIGTTQFAGMTKAEIQGYFDKFINEIVNSETGYDPGFKDKSFFKTLEVLPLSYLIIWIVVMCFFGLVTVLMILKIIKRQAKIRHWIGLIILGILFGLLLYLFIGAMTGNLFGYLIKIISPLSNIVPIGNPQTYMDKAHANVIDFFNRGELSLQGTDPSGMGTNPVLNRATESVAIFSYIVVGIIAILLIWFIWFILKKNKVIKSNFGGSYF